MATIHSRMAELVFKHLTDDLSEEEKIELNRLLADPGNRKLFEELNDSDRTALEIMRMSQAHHKGSWKKIESAYDFNGYKVHLRRYLAAAAIILPVIGLTTFYFFNKPAGKKAPPVAQTVTAAFQRSKKAIWRSGANLAVALDEVADGIVGYSAGLPVMKDNGELIYATAKVTEPALPDTLETLRGGFYRLRLPDGSKVWLNSKSSVFFAGMSAGKDRNVCVEGEAFFEVAKDASRPFVVRVPGLHIEVTGTKFNVKAYKAEAVKTTLLEGSVKLNADGGQVTFLKPGDQALYNPKKKLSKVKKVVNPNNATAWTRGTFLFDNEDLRDIISELARWYDLDVEYRGTVSSQTFFGTFSRSEAVESILAFLQTRTGVRLSIQNKTIFVQP